MSDGGAVAAEPADRTVPLRGSDGCRDFHCAADDRGQKPAESGLWRTSRDGGGGLVRPGNGVRGPLTPIDEGGGPLTPRAEASDGGKGPFTHDGRGARWLNRCCRQRVTVAGTEAGYLAGKGDADPAPAAGRVSRRGFRRRGLG